MAKKKPNADLLKDLEDGVFRSFEALIGDGKFILGDKMTLADLVVFAQLSSYIKVGLIFSREFHK